MRSADLSLAVLSPAVLSPAYLLFSNRRRCALRKEVYEFMLLVGEFFEAPYLLLFEFSLLLIDRLGDYCIMEVVGAIEIYFILYVTLSSSEWSIGFKAFSL
jgi:hypothetical protein